MAILKNDRKKEKVGHKLVGAVVPPYVHEFMTLYTLAKGTTKSRLFKTMMEEWMGNKRAEESDDKLLAEIIDRLNCLREVDRATHRATSFEKYKQIVWKELESKGLKKTYITLIINELTP
jgi:hypothetical protein